jgi:hypothetical protein
MGKRPSFQFYPGDWLRDSAAGCSLAAQGLWLRMMFVGHDSDRYGYLVQNGMPISPESIARRCGCPLEQYEELLAELFRAGVPSHTPEGIIYSRRMVRDESLREIRANGGIESLNNPNVARPKPKDGVKDGAKDTAKGGGKDGREDTSETSSCEASEVSLGVSLSSSSSSSSSNQKVKTITSNPDGSDQSVLVENVHPTEVDQSLEEVWAYYLKEIRRDPKQYTWSLKRKRMGEARLLDLRKRCGSLECALPMMKICVDRLKQSAFHNGANQTGRKYRDWEHLFRSTEQMERWLNDDND